MGTSPEAAAGTALEDLPEDALLCILALLAPPDAAAAACACRRLASAAYSPSLPPALALRLGVPCPLPSPSPPDSPDAARRLLRSLHRLRRLRGLWRRLPSSSTSQSPSLAAFEWAAAAPRATLAASLLAPSSARGGGVSRSPFVTLSIADSGDTVAAAVGDVPVSVNFVGNNHIVVEAAAGEDEQEVEMVSGSPPEEMYAHFANRRSPGAGRRRRGKHGRRGGGFMEPEHFVRIADAEPTLARPLQGLWKGICEDRTLEFYLVAYDDIGGVTCRRFSDTRGQNSGYSPVFWTTDTTFLEPPFSEQELDNYSNRYHIQGVTSNHAGSENRVISRILCINSSHDVVDPHLPTPVDDGRSVEGRIWLYEDGTFGFGFVGSDSVIDLRWKPDRQKLQSVVIKSNGNLNTLTVAYDLLYIKLGTVSERNCQDIQAGARGSQWLGSDCHDSSSLRKLVPTWILSALHFLGQVHYPPWDPESFANNTFVILSETIKWDGRANFGSI